MQLIYLKNKDIDYKLWDEKIEVSVGHFPYAKSWFLDIVSPGWEAIVSENYEYLMPLPVKKKMGLSYLIQPAITQQVGVFSAETINEIIVNQFINNIPYFSYQLNLNETNFISTGISLPNYVLSLQKSSDEISNLFSKNTVRNIEKANNAGLTAHKLDLGNEIKHFMTENANDSYRYNLPIIFDLIEKAYEHDAMEIWGVRNPTGILIASACFHKTTKRLIYVFPVSNSEGRSNCAMFLLINSIINNYSEKYQLLDFEGSQIESIARFYKGFGAINMPYYMVKKNRPQFLIGKI